MNSLFENPQPNQNPHQDRFYALDTLRACALLAGIVLHAVMSFLPGFRETHWPLADNSTSTSLGILYFVIHLCRMTLFFVIAGFFAHLLHQRLGTKGFIKNRLKRIGLPLVAAFIFIMPLTIIPFIWAGRQLGVQGPPKMEFPFPVMGPPIPWGHLWFLYVLLIIYLIVLGIRSLIVMLDVKESLRTAITHIISFCFKTRAMVFLLTTPVATALFFLQWWPQWQGIPAPIVGLVPNFPALLAYVSAFLIGWFLHKEQDCLRVLATHWPLYFAGACVGAITALYVAGIKPAFTVLPLNTLERAIFAGSYIFAQWCGVFAFIGIAVAYIKTPDAKWRYLADGSYWMYLIHLPIVWLLQAWMLQWQVHWSIKLSLTFVLTSVLLLSSYHYLVRNSFIGKFLNGKRYPSVKIKTDEN